MIKTLIENETKFRIIPENFKAAAICNLIDTRDDYFEVELIDNDSKDYDSETEVELFTSNKTGILYFVSSVLERKGSKIRIKMPETHKILQRREFSRVEFKNSVKIDGTRVVPIDISAGGMRIFSNTPYNVAQDYNIEIELYNTQINCIFQPIRTEENSISEKEYKYTVSGRFKNIESIDRISLVQFCFKTQMENRTKNDD